MTYIKRVGIGVDQLFNAILNGSPDETLSSRLYRLDRDRKLMGRVFRPVVDLLFFFDPDHCFTSYLAERDRKHLAEEFQKDSA